MLDKRTILEKAICFYGDDQQKIVAMKELAELTKEISKNIRGKSNRKNIIEEIADVRIMMEQLMLMLDISEKEIEDEVSFKLVRLNGRMDDADI